MVDERFQTHSAGAAVDTLLSYDRMARPILLLLLLLAYELVY